MVLNFAEITGNATQTAVIATLMVAPLWKLSSGNRVTPVSIQDGVQHGITFAAISTIPEASSPMSAKLSPIPEAIGGHAVTDTVMPIFA